MGGKDGVPGNGVAGGHSVEQLAGGIELAGAAEGSNPEVVEKHIPRGHGMRERFRGSA